MKPMESLLFLAQQAQANQQHWHLHSEKKMLDPIEYDLGGNIQQFLVIRAKRSNFRLRTFSASRPGRACDPETQEGLNGCC